LDVLEIVEPVVLHVHCALGDDPLRNIVLQHGLTVSLADVDDADLGLLATYQLRKCQGSRRR